MRRCNGAPVRVAPISSRRASQFVTISPSPPSAEVKCDHKQVGNYAGYTLGKEAKRQPPTAAYAAIDKTDSRLFRQVVGRYNAENHANHICSFKFKESF